MPTPDEHPYMTLLNLVSQVATILGVIGLWIAFRSLRNSRDTFHHGVITSCTDRFQHLSPKLSQLPLSDEALQQYLELCNEEVFYFENDYLPQAIIDEWLDGMLSYISLRRGDGSFFQLSQIPAQSIPDLSPLLSVEQHQLLENYPRLKYAFSLSQQDELKIQQVQQQWGNDAARAQMVLTVLGNLKVYQQQPFLEHLRRVRAEAW